MLDADFVKILDRRKTEAIVKGGGYGNGGRYETKNTRRCTEGVP